MFLEKNFSLSLTCSSIGWLPSIPPCPTSKIKSGAEISVASDKIENSKMGLWRDLISKQNLLEFLNRPMKMKETQNVLVENSKLQRIKVKWKTFFSVHDSVQFSFSYCQDVPRNEVNKLSKLWVAPKKFVDLKKSSEVRRFERNFANYD